MKRVFCLAQLLVATSLALPLHAATMTSKGNQPGDKETKPVPSQSKPGGITGLKDVPSELVDGAPLNFVILGNGKCDVDVDYGGMQGRQTLDLPATVKTIAHHYGWKPGETSIQYKIVVKGSGACSTSPVAQAMLTLKRKPEVNREAGK